MRHPRLWQAILLSMALGAPTAAIAVDADHHHHEASPAALQLNHGQKWQTDAPLRQGMTTLREAFAAKLPAIHKGQLSKADYAALGGVIEAQVGNIVSQCKLEPKADAALHVIIGELVQAADVMKGSAKGKPANAAHRAVIALDNYGKYFEHPGWQAIK